MATAQTFHGARAKVSIGGTVIGIFNSCSYGVSYDMQPIYTLGRFSPAEIVPTGQEAISVSATGFHVLDKGPYVVAGMSQLEDLLNSSDTHIDIIDRQSDPERIIAHIEGIRTTSFQTAVNARGVQEITVNFIGLRLNDESATSSNESGTATSL